MMVFIALAIIGLLFLIISASGGDHEVHFDHGYDHDSGDQQSGPSPFSLRIISIFLSTFGACGAIAKYYVYSTMESSLIGMVGGLVFSYIAWCIMGVLYNQQSSSMVGEADFKDAIGVVFTTIPKDGIGEVTFTAKKQQKSMPARSNDGAMISIGKRVKFIQNVGGIVIVEIQ